MVIYLASVILICPFCRAEIERPTEKEAEEALAQHKQYVKCEAGY